MVVWERASAQEEDCKGEEKNRVQIILNRRHRSLEEYEAFDDWLELVVEFGYIILFAAAFPFACLWGFVCNIIEALSDRGKILYLTRRSEPRRLGETLSCSNGSNTNNQPPPSSILYPAIWVRMLKLLVCFSVLTNCLIFGVSSHQLRELVEDWFHPTVSTSSNSKVNLNQNLSRATLVWCTFGVEHFLGLCCYFLYSLIP